MILQIIGTASYLRCKFGWRQFIHGPIRFFWRLKTLSLSLKSLTILY